MKIHSITPLLILLLATNFLFGQNISGKVIESSGSPAGFATVTLHQANDSSLVKGAVTGEDGAFEIKQVKPGLYFVKVSLIGSGELSIPVFEVGQQDKSLETLQLPAASKELAQVTIISRRPPVEVKADKTVLNVEGTVNSTGLNALELLRKAPGVTVDNNDNVNVKGKSGVLIMIDGRLTPLDGKDMAALLKSTQAADIANIEIISNPSAKYDAAGNAGIINIRLKKNKAFGTNGNAGVELIYGKTAKAGMNLSLNNRGKAYNVFGSYNNHYGDWHNTNDFSREQSGFLFDQKSEQIGTSHWNSARAGADWFINSKHTVGVLLNGSYNDGGWNASSRASISNLTTREKVDSLLVAQSIEDPSRKNLNANLNYRFQDTSGNSLNIDLDYGVFRNSSRTYQPNYYKSPDNSEVFSQAIVRMYVPTDVDIMTAKIDYERRLLGGVFGTGVKIANVETDNVFEQSIVMGDRDSLDRSASNAFVYKERTSAAYVNYNRMFGKKLNVQTGLRLENTDYMGDLTAYDPANAKPKVENNYTKLFPSAAVTYSFTSKIGLNTTYSRRIDRPSYQNLNPFVNRLDELTYEQGNAFLRPQFTNSFEISPTYSGYPVVTFGYSKTKDVFTQVIFKSKTDTLASYITNENLADQRNLTLTLNAPTPITKWWDGFVSLTGMHSKFSAQFENAFNIDEVSFYSLSVYGEQNFKLPMGFGMQLSGWYNSPAYWGTLRSNAQGAVDLGFQKKIWDGKGEVRLRFGDILRTAGWKGENTFTPGLRMVAQGTWESNTVTLNFSYRFGSSDVKSARQRKTGLEDEKNRVKSGK